MFAFVQEKTGMSSSIILDSLREIFKNISDRKGLNHLEDLGVIVRYNIDGRRLPNVEILKNIASSFVSFDENQRNSIIKLMSGIVQSKIFFTCLCFFEIELAMKSHTMNF